MLDGSLPYKSWRGKVRTARLLMAVPEITLMIGGGHPAKAAMPRLTKKIKELAERRGAVLHRWSGRAFILKKQPPIEAEA